MLKSTEFKRKQFTVSINILAIIVDGLFIDIIIKNI